MTMSRHREYQFTAEQIARHVCLDCGRNVVELGDYCMVNDDIWKDQLGLKWDDNLCIECVEARVGRELTCEEVGFGFTPAVEGYPKSERLMTRIYPDYLERLKRRAKKKAKAKKKARS